MSLIVMKVPLFICCKQYVGQTVDIFRSRWNNYKSNDRKYLVGNTLCRNRYLSILTVKVILGFFVSVTFIDKIDSQNPEKREKYWIHTSMTMIPWSLNILNSV